MKGIERVGLFTENAERLAKFYKEKVGLKLIKHDMKGMDEKLFYMEGHGASFFIMDHSKVRGKNKQPERIIFNFEVADIKNAAEKLEKSKVKKIADAYRVPGYGWIATFQDIDGNYFQLVQLE